MAYETESRVGQFRSNVQWFLEGNTPSYKAEQIVDLVVALKVLAKHLHEAATDGERHDEFLLNLSAKFNSVTRNQFEDTNQLKAVVTSLIDIAKARAEQADSKVFRDVVVQLIVIAENHLDLPFRRSVIELAEML